MSKYKVHFSESKVLSFNVRKFTSETTVQDDAMKLYRKCAARVQEKTVGRSGAVNLLMLMNLHLRFDDAAVYDACILDDGLHDATMGPCELEDSILYSDMTIEEKDAKLCKVTKLYRDNIQYI